MNEGPEDNYTFERVRVRLIELLNKFNSLDDEFMDIFKATVAVDDPDLLLALNTLKENKNPKINTLAKEMLAKWKPVAEGPPTLVNPKVTKSSAKKNQRVIDNMPDDPKRNIIVDSAQKTMNGNGGGEVKHTHTDGVDVIHTSVPDLRVKGNRKVGSKTEPTDEAKDKLYQVYYNAFRMAHNLNSNDNGKSSKPLSCPVLGSGKFKWPAEVSAEIAGKAMGAFRAKYGNDLQIDLFMRREDLNNRITQAKLQTVVDKGIQSHSTEKSDPKNANALKTIAEINQFIKKIRSYKDNQQRLKPLASDLEKIINSGLPLNSKLWEVDLLIQRTLDLAESQNYRAISANINLALETSSNANKSKKETVVRFSSGAAITDMHGRPPHEYKRQKNKKNQELPSIEELNTSPLRTVYVTVTYPQNSKLNPVERAFKKLTNGTFLHNLESASKDLRDTIATTTDPSAATEWAEQLKDDLISAKATDNVIVASFQLPDILFHGMDPENSEQNSRNYLDTTLLKKLVATEEGKSLLKINQTALYSEFDIAKEQVQTPSPLQPRATSTSSSTVAPTLPPLPVRAFTSVPENKQPPIDPRKNSVMAFLSTVQKNMASPYASKEAKQHLIDDANKYRIHPDKEISDKANAIWSKLVGFSIGLVVPPLPVRKTEKASDLQDVDIGKMYKNERSVSLDRNKTLNAFALNAVRRITFVKNPDRDNQIAGLQALVYKVNDAKDPDTENAATRELVLALLHVKYQISHAKKAISPASALNAVCDKIMSSIPNKDSYLNYENAGRPYNQGEINLIGKVALDKAIPDKDKLESKSKGKPR